MRTKKLLKINIKPYKKGEVLEKIISYMTNPSGFMQVVSINPENVVIAQKHGEFLNVLNESTVQIIDGNGVLLGGSFLNIDVGDRLPGVDLMQQVLDLNEKMPLRVLFLGGKPNIAEYLSNCYNQKYPKSQFFGLQGIENISTPKNEEEMRIFSIVSATRPQIIFAAFGSPAQELWFDRHRAQLQGIVCMGVGGGFDFISGKIQRAPSFIRVIGMEWLFRLMVEPWRWRRQLRLFTFIYLILKQKIQQLF